MSSFHDRDAFISVFSAIVSNISFYEHIRDCWRELTHSITPRTALPLHFICYIICLKYTPFLYLYNKCTVHVNTLIGNYTIIIYNSTCNINTNAKNLHVKLCSMWNSNPQPPLVGLSFKYMKTCDRECVYKCLTDIFIYL